MHAASKICWPVSSLNSDVGFCAARTISKDAAITANKTRSMNRFVIKVSRNIWLSFHIVNGVYVGDETHSLLLRGTIEGYGFQVGLFILSARRSGYGNRATLARITGRRKASGAARRYGIREDVYDGAGHRAAESSHHCP